MRREMRIVMSRTLYRSENPSNLERMIKLS